MSTEEQKLTAMLALLSDADDPETLKAVIVAWARIDRRTIESLAVQLETVNADRSKALAEIRELTKTIGRLTAELRGKACSHPTAPNAEFALATDEIPDFPPLPPDVGPQPPCDACGDCSRVPGGFHYCFQCFEVPPPYITRNNSTHDAFLVEKQAFRHTDLYRDYHARMAEPMPGSILCTQCMVASPHRGYTRCASCLEDRPDTTEQDRMESVRWDGSKERARYLNERRDA